MAEKKILDNQVDLSAYDTAAAAAQKVAAAVESGDEQTLVAAKNYADTQAAAALQDAKEYTAEEIGKLNYIKFVDSLPQTGESKYIYAVVQDERTPDDEAIVLLFVWTGTEFAAVGVMSGVMDASVFQPYVDAAQAAQTGAETAQKAAESARDAAQSAQTAAEAAQGAAESARTAAETAKGQVENFASSAQSAATAAQTSAGSADIFAQAALSSQQAAAGSASAASSSADLAQKWATQTTAEVVSGQGYGAKYYADQAADSASSANTSASQATTKATEASSSAIQAAQSAQEAASSASLADIQNKISNCLTKIPQDINLELSSAGTLTLKAGSKLYIPNGAGVFNEVVTSIDYQMFLGTPTGSRTVFFVANSSNNLGVVVAQNRLNLFSGDTQPTASTQTAYWYDTANNVIKRTTDTGASWSVLTNATLPICVATFNAGVATSIDQVFNGFGFIGKTIFVLPGVEGLYPNGRNADGSLNNVSVIVNAVMTYTSSSAGQREVYLRSNDFSDVGEAAIDYDETKNKNIYTSNGTTASYALVGRAVRTEGGNIVSLTPKNVFHAVDYNEIKIADYVIETYSDDSGNWYRVYKSGWVEQGGITDSLAGSAKKTVTFLKPMANENYATNIASTPGGLYTGNGVEEKTSTSMSVHNSSQESVKLCWFIIGQGA